LDITEFNKGELSQSEPVFDGPAAIPAPSAPGTGTEDGLQVEDYAHMSGMPVREVWRLVREGKLLSRSEQGKVFVYPAETVDSWDGLPPIPRASEGPGIERSSGDGHVQLIPAASSSLAQTTEFALFVDHLSLAKEENREILRLTQAALNKVTSLSDELVKMKDQVITAKDAQIEALQSALAAAKKDLSATKQANEDLETLARTLLSQ
jgi:hypothetical protein